MISQKVSQFEIKRIQTTFDLGDQFDTSDNLYLLIKILKKLKIDLAHECVDNRSKDMNQVQSFSFCQVD